MARIFLAIRFEDEVKRKLVEIQDTLKQRGVQGNYCPYNNLHLTLIFIGEKYDLPAIRQAVNEVQFEPFSLSLDYLGSFPTKDGVIWSGVKERRLVSDLVEKLRERLTMNGVSFKDLPFFPHVSLVQHPSEIVTDVDLPDVSIPVARISVMKSERIEGELVYHEI